MQEDTTRRLLNLFDCIIGLEWEKVILKFERQQIDFFVNDSLDHGSAIMTDYIVIYGHENGNVHTFASRESYDMKTTEKNCQCTLEFLGHSDFDLSIREALMVSNAALVEQSTPEKYVSIDLGNGRSLGMNFLQGALVRIGGRNLALM